MGRGEIRVQRDIRIVGSWLMLSFGFIGTNA